MGQACRKQGAAGGAAAWGLSPRCCGMPGQGSGVAQRRAGSKRWNRSFQIHQPLPPGPVLLRAPSLVLVALVLVALVLLGVQSPGKPSALTVLKQTRVLMGCK